MVDNAHGVPSIGVYPRVLELGQGDPPESAWPVDLAVTSCSTDSLEIRAASVRGFLHRARRAPRQDAFAVQQGNDGTVLVVVCDGVGSLPLSERAAQLICDTLPDLYRASGDWTVAITQVNDLLRELQNKEQAARGTSERLLASTVTACRVRQGDSRLELSYAFVGDSELWVLRDGTWSPVFGAEHNQDGLYSTSVRPIPTTTPLIGSGEATVDADAVFLFTDGVSVPLAMGPDVQDALAGWWAVPPDPFSFASQVGFARRSFVDDRTAVGVWSRSRLCAHRPPDQAGSSVGEQAAEPPSSLPENGEREAEGGKTSIDQSDAPASSAEDVGATVAISEEAREGA